MAELCPGEIARVVAGREAGVPLRWKESCGALLAYGGDDDEHPMFTSRSWEAFHHLWQQAEAIYNDHEEAGNG